LEDPERRPPRRGSRPEYAVTWTGIVVTEEISERRKGSRGAGVVVVLGG
jgi:hypothetical protein